VVVRFSISDWSRRGIERFREFISGYSGFSVSIREVSPSMLTRVEVGGRRRGREADHPYCRSARCAAEPRQRRLRGLLDEKQEYPPVVQGHQPADRLDRLGRVRAGEAVVPHLPETAGQDVLQEASDELHCVERHVAGAVGAARAVGEGDFPVVAGDDPPIADHHAERIRSQILQARLAIADGSQRKRATTPIIS